MAVLFTTVRSPAAACTCNLISRFLMQSKGGESPAGFVADEFQEWFRLRALPAIKEAAITHFQPGVNDWFDADAYDELCAAVQFDATGEDPMFVIAQDSDPRHTMTDLGQHSSRRTAKGKPVDRRCLRRGQKGYIPIDPLRNYVPNAPKVPDCLQFPIESFYGKVKKHYRKQLANMDSPTAREMIAAMLKAFVSAQEKDAIKRCFEHGAACMQVLSGFPGETYDYNGKTYHCTYGRWMPKDLAG